MKIAKFWARESASAEDSSGYLYRLISWSGSNISIDEAKEKAKIKLNRWLEQLRQGKSLNDYPYMDRTEIREEVIEELHDGQGELIAAITRNRYGALVLNSKQVLFADVDLPAARLISSNFLDSLLSLLGLNKNATPVLSPRDKLRQKFVTFQQQRPDCTLRVYETAAGFRLVVMNALFNPTDHSTEELLKSLNSDELYIRLCRAQNCFRARLTPKPWRCEHYLPPNTFPRETADAQQRYSDWLKDYQAQSRNYSVCNLIDELGEGSTDITVDAVIDLHDRHVLDVGNQPLA